MKDTIDIFSSAPFKSADEIVQYFDSSNLVIASNETGVHDFRLRVPAGKRTQEHYTMHFCLRGKGTIIVAGKAFPIKENDLFVIPPNISIDTVPDKDDPWKYFWLGLNGDGFLKMLSQARISVDSPAVSMEEDAEQIRKAINDFIDFCPANDSAMRLRAISLALFIFSLITERAQKNDLAEPSDFSKEYYLKKTIDMIYENYSDPDFRIENICKELAISHSYLCKIFKKFSNVTVTRFLSQIRMRQARLLLDKDELSIKNVAFSCGYSDYPYFAKEFKKMFTITPGQYRKKQKQEKTPEQDDDLRS